MENYDEILRNRTTIVSNQTLNKNLLINMNKLCARELSFISYILLNKF